MGIDLQEPGRRRRPPRPQLPRTETRAPAAPKKKKRRLFGKDDDADARLEGYVGDEAFEHAVIDDEDSRRRAAPGRGPARAPGVRRPTQAEIAVEKIKAAQGLGSSRRPAAARRTPPRPFRSSPPAWWPPAR